MTRSDPFLYWGSPVGRNAVAPKSPRAPRDPRSTFSLRRKPIPVCASQSPAKKARTSQEPKQPRVVGNLRGALARPRHLIFHDILLDVDIDFSLYRKIKLHVRL